MGEGGNREIIDPTVAILFMSYGSGSRFTQFSFTYMVSINIISSYMHDHDFVTSKLLFYTGQSNLLFAQWSILFHFSIMIMISADCLFKIKVCNL